MPHGKSRGSVWPLWLLKDGEASELGKLWALRDEGILLKDYQIKFVNDLIGQTPDLRTSTASRGRTARLFELKLRT